MKKVMGLLFLLIVGMGLFSCDYNESANNALESKLLYNYELTDALMYSTEKERIENIKIILESYNQNAIEFEKYKDVTIGPKKMNRDSALWLANRFAKTYNVLISQDKELAKKRNYKPVKYINLKEAVEMQNSFSY